MMSKSFSYNIPFRFFLSSLKKQTPVSLLCSAFTLLICPGILIHDIFTELTMYKGDELFYLNHTFYHYSLLLFVLSLGVMFILTLINFGFLYSKKAGDTFHALPLTRNQLFSCRFCSTLLGTLFSFLVSYLSLSFINFLPFVDGVGAKAVFTVGSAAILLLIFCTAFTCLFAVVSSSYFNFIISLASFNLFIPAMYFLIMLWRDMGYGVLLDGTGVIYTSPYIYSVIKMARFSFVNISIPAFSLVTVILCLFLSALFIFLSLLLFKKRKSETAGQPFSFGFMYTLTTISASFCGGAAIGYLFSLGEIESAAFWSFFILASILTSIAIGALLNKNFKAIKKSLIFSAVSIALLLNLSLTGIFISRAEVGYVPEKEKIETLYINNTLAMPDDYDTFIALHKQGIKQEEDIFEKSSFYITLDYTLKNGVHIKRGYTLHSNEAYCSYLKSKTYLSFFENPLVPDDTYVYFWDSQKEEDINLYLSASEYKALCKAYAQDILESSADDFKEEPIYSLSGEFSRNGYGNLVIYPAYSETISLLEQIKNSPEVVY